MKAARFVGIDVGSTNIKICALSDGALEHRTLSHEGNVADAAQRILGDLGLYGDEASAPLALVTGTEARYRFDLPEAIAPVAVERALAEKNLSPKAVVSMGGEDLVVYTLDEKGRIVTAHAGNKCASGTGEFFRQQLGRMDLHISDLARVAEGSKVVKLSARCSVFMKSDCTHRLNKGESTVGDIALSLSKVMADKVSEFLTKARIREGQVVLVGGVTKNRFIVEFLSEAWPGLEFVVPEESPFFEAYGASLLAADRGRPLPPASGLFKTAQALSYATYPSLGGSGESVRYVPSRRGAFREGAEHILGVDGGSTTTKVALIDAETLEIVAEHYGRTHGDPVTALKLCIAEVKKQLGGKRPKISLVATTGSSRELLGVFLETAAVYNEIIAHTVGTTFFEPAVDTIFEIGGQDAKYVLINNGVPIDYAMNEACSAGTGSFLEESARGDLSIETAQEIGPVALEAKAPLKFGEHCSAFINSDIRKAIQQGAAREDIVAGLVFSIVSNYLNRVVGNRRVGAHIVLQGGVAKNPAVPLAFAQLTQKVIVVPPDPELMGCFGVALLARTKHAEGAIEKGEFDLDAILDTAIETKGTFVCKSCDNLCPIRRLEVRGHSYPFGGRCSKYTNARKKRHIDQEKIVDYTAERARLIFEEHAPKAEAFAARTDKVVGAPMAFSMHSLWPFYSWFFHELGVRLVPSTSISPEGLAKIESNYCFPAEIAHGAIQDILDKGTDYVFLPFFRDMPSTEKEPVHATVCPLTQGLPFFARQAFNLGDDRVLRPLVSFKKGFDASRPEFEAVAEKLGFSRAQGAAAYDKAIAEYTLFLRHYRQYGREVLARIEADPSTIYVALLGRPYNAFTRDANMGIPRKFTSQGVTVVPFDMIFEDDASIFPNMYWYYGQQDMKAVRKIAAVKNLYATWITNFSCAPDSFMLHYLRWMMGRKPYLVLEIDSHSADAGIDTRIEAFLDIVASFRKAGLEPGAPMPKRRFEIALKKEFCDVVDNVTGERIDIRDPRVTLIWPSMGDLATAATAAAARKAGVKSFHLPVPDVQTTQLARDHASGKECIPSLLVLGLILQFLKTHPPNRENEILLFFVPSTLGPCRTGQYFVFYERLLEELGYHNAVILVADSSNSYREMGPTFNRDIWWGLVLGDYFTDARTGLALLAKDPDEAMRLFDACWADVLDAVEKGGDIEAAVARAGRTFTAIPRKRALGDVRRVLIVGEIYVRRDTFSVTEVTEFLIGRGIFPKVTGITEWVGYTDHCRWREMDKRRREEGLIGSLRAGGWKDRAWYEIEKFYTEMVEHKIARHLKPTGLIPEVPHDMHEIIGNADRLFIDPELESEATCSSGCAVTGMNHGYDGVAIIAPFACLPGRLIEGVYAPWARQRGYPVIALENDGQPYPPNVVARMEIFAHNVNRYRD